MSQKLENWLYEHFSEECDEVLAGQLTELIKKEYGEKVKILREVRKGVTHPGTLRSIDKEIDFYESFTCVTASYIRTVANRIKCPRKKGSYLSSINRQKALVTKRKKWLQLAQAVDSPYEWVRHFRPREVKYIKVENEKQIKDFNNIKAYFNRVGYEGCRYTLECEVDREIMVIRCEAKLIRKF